MSRLEIDQAQLAEICRRHGIRRLSLFGSVLRDDFGPDSDVDLLVEFEPDRVPGYLGLAKVERDLQSLFGQRPIDLLTPKSISPLIREKVLASAEEQYAAG